MIIPSTSLPGHKLQLMILHNMVGNLLIILITTEFSVLAYTTKLAIFRHSQLYITTTEKRPDIDSR